jgi:hypothetical protein
LGFSYVFIAALATDATSFRNFAVSMGLVIQAHAGKKEAREISRAFATIKQLPAQWRN